MAVEVRLFKISDVREINRQFGDGSDDEKLSDAHFVQQEKSDNALTISIGGRIIACAGVVPFYDGRGEVWAIIDRDCRKEFLTLFKVFKKLLKNLPIKRVEAVVIKKFKEGHRMAKLLGFELEAESMRSYSPAGKDCALYARVKK
jgi:hypothetical protein